MEPYSLSTDHKTEVNCGEGRGGRGTRKGEDHLSFRICIMQWITVRTQFHKCMQVGIGGVNMEGGLHIHELAPPPGQRTLTAIGPRVNDIGKEFRDVYIYISISEARHLQFFSLIYSQARQAGISAGHRAGTISPQGSEEASDIGSSACGSIERLIYMAISNLVSQSRPLLGPPRSALLGPRSVRRMDCPASVRRLNPHPLHRSDIL